MKLVIVLFCLEFKVKRYIQDIKENGRRSRAMRRASKTGNGNIIEFSLESNVKIFDFNFIFSTQTI